MRRRRNPSGRGQTVRNRHFFKEDARVATTHVQQLRTVRRRGVGGEMPFVPTRAALISRSDLGRGCDVWRRRASSTCGWTEETGRLLSTDHQVLLWCNGCGRTQYFYS